MKKQRVLFTTSWDDGSTHDIKLAEVLSNHGVKGTFYIPIINIEGRQTIGPAEIRELAERFEIGGHTYSHRILTTLTDQEAEEEVRKGREAIEDIVGRRITGFCFPRGKFNKAHLEILHRNKFDYARTTGYMRTKDIVNREMGLLHTTIQLFPRAASSYVLSCVHRQDREGTCHSIRNYFVAADWRRFAEKLLKDDQNDPIHFHLWGHSWEIHEYNLWNRLKDFIKDIKENRDVLMLTNGELWDECRKADSVRA